jgi:rare lipoprotein A
MRYPILIGLALVSFSTAAQANENPIEQVLKNIFGSREPVVQQQTSPVYVSRRAARRMRRYEDAGTPLVSSGKGHAVFATWYGHEMLRKGSGRTANGERFHPGGLTAAHRSLPFGTRVHVTNRLTGRSVIVRINDRGPFGGRASYDLSHGSARAIGLTSSGSIMAHVIR